VTAVINRELSARVEAMGSPRRVVLDIDSTEIPVYGQRGQSAYNGTLNRPATIRCSCSTGRATVWP